MERSLYDAAKMQRRESNAVKDWIGQSQPFWDEVINVDPAAGLIQISRFPGEWMTVFNRILPEMGSYVLVIRANSGPVVLGPPPEDLTMLQFAPADPNNAEEGKLYKLLGPDGVSFRVVTVVQTATGLEYHNATSDPQKWNAVFSGSWGTTGLANGQFSGIRGIAVDLKNEWVYVSSDNRVQKFSFNGTYISTIATLGSADGQVNTPWGLAVDGFGYLYIVDSGNARIQKFIDGVYDSKVSAFDTPMNTPKGAFFAGQVYLHVVDSGNNRVLTIETMVLTHTRTEVYSDHPLTTPNGIIGIGTPYIGIGTAPPRSQFIVNSGVHEVAVYKNGVFTFSFGSLGSGPGQFSSPTSIALDEEENMHVVDTNNHRVQVFDKNGIYLGYYGQLGSGNDDFNSPTAIAITTDYIYIADSGNNRIVIRTNPAANLRNDGFQVPFLVYNGSTVTQWSNQPVAATEFFGNANFRKPVDLTGISEFRITAHIFTAGAGGAKWHLEYSTNGGSSWSDCGTQATQEIDVGTTGQKKGEWTILDIPARDDILLRLVGTGGDGVASPFPTNLSVHFR